MTPEEEDTVGAMLRKVDILPLPVRIDAVIAEVTLNDQLQSAVLAVSPVINNVNNIPLLGLPAGSQNNMCTRTELLVPITPHVLHDHRAARALTIEWEKELPNAAAVAPELQSPPRSGSDDPNRRVRRALQIGG